MLIYLVKTEGEKTPMGVASFFKVTKAMVTNMISSLVKQGYLQKEKSEKDKRSVFLVPTQLAITLVEETYTAYYKTMTVLQQKMGDADFAAFISLLKKANQSLLDDKSNA